MTSGAFRSTNLRKRLLRLIIRRYKSFRSLVAKFPLSSRTNGRRSGGITGITSSTIHSGLLSLSRIDSTIFKRLVRSFRFCFDPVSANSARRLLEMVTRSISPSSSRTASAPIAAVKLVGPNSAFAARYSSSVSSCCFSSSEVPGSVTT